MRYCKKPIMIEAFRWTGGPDQGEEPAWICEAIASGDVFFRRGVSGIQMSIVTLEGTMIANLGDYIIKGIKNEIYPCKADIFEATYEKVEE